MEYVGPLIIVITIALCLAVTGMIKVQEREGRDAERARKNDDRTDPSTTPLEPETK